MINVLFFILLAALIGGLIAKLINIPPLVGYIMAGVVGGLLFSFDPHLNQTIAEIGVILLLFSVGLEISLEKLMKVGKIAIIGGLIQIVVVTGISFLFLTTLLNIATNPALVLSLAFSFSSTALIVKVMQDREETGTIHNDILMGWALVQDLAVIPIVVLLPTLTLSNDASAASIAFSSILTTVLVLGIVLLSGRLIAPYLTKLVAMTNNMELLILLAITLALGIAGLVSLFGISAAFGAFLAGVVISKTQENHAIFSETRPLRDIFSILFFVSLGFLITPAFIFSHLPTIVVLTIFIIIVKLLTVFILCIIFGYRGKTAVAVSIGLAQIGEFAFVLFLISQKMGIMDDDIAQIGISATLFSLLISPFLFKEIIPIWKLLKVKLGDSSFKKYLIQGFLSSKNDEIVLENHIIICGFGRMGKWVGKALKEFNVNYIVIDYNHRTVRLNKKEGENILYGDASFPEILDEANIKSAKAIIITLPDRIAEQEIITFVQKYYPNVKITARAQLESDVKILNNLNVEKVIQPEFEAALTVVKKVLSNLGRPKPEVDKKIRAMRLAHSKI